jgi:hypothetical protein
MFLNGSNQLGNHPMFERSGSVKELSSIPVSIPRNNNQPPLKNSNPVLSLFL